MATNYVPSCLLLSFIWTTQVILDCIRNINVGAKMYVSRPTINFWEKYFEDNLAV